MVPWRGPAIFTADFARTIDLVISIGDAFRGFHRQRLYTDSDALAVRRGHPAAAKLKNARVPERAACCRRHPRPERGSDRHLAPTEGHRTEDRTGRARLYRGVARHRAHRSGRLRAAPPDRRAVEAIVACDHHAAVRSRDRRAVHVLPDPRPMDTGSIWLRTIMLGIGREMERGEQRDSYNTHRCRPGLRAGTHSHRQSW